MKPRKTDFVIHYVGTPKSYFDRMTPVGPAFGAKLSATPRYASEESAQGVVARFPFVAAVMCVIKPVLGQKPRARG